MTEAVSFGTKVNLAKLKGTFKWLALRSNPLLIFLSKPPEERDRVRIERSRAPFRKLSPLFAHMDNGMTDYILKHVQVEQYYKDQLIVKEEEIGTKFYLIVSGKVSVYFGHLSGKKPGQQTRRVSVQTGPVSLTDRRTGSKIQKEMKSVYEMSYAEIEAVISKSKRRDILGRLYSTLGAGGHFGEVALLSEDGIRHESVVADEETFILAFDKNLYGLTIKLQQENEYKLRTQFVGSHPFFAHSPDKVRNQLQSSLDHTTYGIGEDIILQGYPTQRLYFIVKGEARIITEPGRHKKQIYSQDLSLSHSGSGEGILPEESSEDVRQITPPPSRRQNLDSVPLPYISDLVAIRRIDGYAAAEKMSFNRVIDLCFVGAGEMLGDIEYLLEIKSYLFTVKCTSECEVYSLEYKTVERLCSKRNLQTLEQMRYSAEMKLSLRMMSEPGKKVICLADLCQRLQDMKIQLDAKSPVGTRDGHKSRRPKRIPETSSCQRLPNLKAQLKQITKLFVENKYPLLVPYTNGAVYYRRLSLRRAEIRAEQREIQRHDSNFDFPSIQRQLSDAKLENFKEVKLYQKKRQRLLSKGNIEEIDITRWKN